MRWLLVLAAAVRASRAAAAEQGDYASKIVEFERWFHVLGGRAPGLEVFHSEEHGYSVRATRDIEAGNEMITIPKEMIFSRNAVLDQKNSEMRGITPEIRNAFARVMYDEDLISLLLLRERAIGNASFFLPYLNILPERAVPVPSMLTDERAKEMLDEPSFFRAKSMSKRRADRYRRIRDSLRIVLRGLKHEKECSTVDAFNWADSIVGSRALTLAKSGKFLMPMADLLNYKSHPETREQNHGQFFEQNHKLGNEMNSFSVFADRDTEKGHEVFEDYGDNDNELYFQAFAFTPLENPFNCVTVRLPQPDTKSKQRRLAMKLKVPQNPDGCLAPDRPVPEHFLYHLHMLSMTEEAAGACVDLVTANPQAGAVPCFDESYTIETAWKKLQEIVAQQLEQPKKAVKPFKEDEKVKPYAPLLADIQTVIDVFAASREFFLRGLLVVPPPAPQELIVEDVDEAAVDDVEDLHQLHGLIAESTTKYLGALRAASNVSREAGRSWSEPVRSMLFALRGEVSKILSNPVGSCSGFPEDEPENWPPVTDAAVAMFNEWFEGKAKLRERPMGLEGTPLKVQAVRLEGFRIGLLATEAIAAEDTYLAVPAAVVLDSKSTLQSYIGQALREVREHFSRSDSFHDILLHLWHERFVLRELSDFWPYLALLPGPSELFNAHFCDDDTLDAALGGSTLPPVVKAQRKGLRDKYDKIVTPIFKKVPFFKKARHHMSFARYEWLTFTLNSRSIWWNKERHLVPMLDFVNCKSAEGMRVHSSGPDEDGEPGVRAIITKAPVAIELGAQIFENYGQPNHVYFLSHGFSVEGNEHDCYRWEQAPGRDTHCLSPKDDLSEDLLTKVGAGYPEKGRLFLLNDLRRRLQLYPEDGETPEGLAGPQALAYTLASTERQLLKRIIARLAERREEL